MNGPLGEDTVRVRNLSLILRCLVTVAVGVLMVFLAVRFGEALWRAITAYGR